MVKVHKMDISQEDIDQLKMVAPDDAFEDIPFIEEDVAFRELVGTLEEHYCKVPEALRQLWIAQMQQYMDEATTRMTTSVEDRAIITNAPLE